MRPPLLVMRFLNLAQVYFIYCIYNNAGFKFHEPISVTVNPPTTEENEAFGMHRRALKEIDEKWDFS